MSCWYTSGRIDQIAAIPSGKIIALDVETTGLSEDDEILQLAIINGSGDTLINQYFKPRRKTAWADAERVNGISPEKVANKPRLEDMAARVRKIITSAELIVVYNARFDMGFLERSGLGQGKSAEVFDVMEEFAPIYGEWRDGLSYKWAKLEECADHYGHTLIHAHNALHDARATLKCFCSMLSDESQYGYLKLCSICAGKDEKAWREYAGDHVARKQTTRKRTAQNKPTRDVFDTVFDELDDSVYSCFLLENARPFVWSSEKAFCKPDTLFRIEKRCAAKRGRLYKSQAKSASWAIIAWPQNCNDRTIIELRNKGFKVARLPEFLEYIGLGRECDIPSWKKCFSSPGNRALKQGEPQSASGLAAKGKKTTPSNVKQKTTIQQGNNTITTNSEGYIVPESHSSQKKGVDGCAIGTGVGCLALFILFIVIAVQIGLFFSDIFSGNGTKPYPGEHSIHQEGSEGARRDQAEWDRRIREGEVYYGGDGHYYYRNPAGFQPIRVYRLSQPEQ